MKNHLSNMLFLAMIVLLALGFVQSNDFDHTVVGQEERETVGPEERQQRMMEEILENLRILVNRDREREDGRPHRERGPHPEMKERIEHMNIAADHLRMAGMHDLAKELHKHVERMEREFDEHARKRDRREHPHEEQLDRIHEEVRELREIIEDQGRMIHKLIDTDRGREDKDR